MEHTIFFDSEKKAYDKMTMISLGFNPISSIDDETWLVHAGKDTWDIVDGIFTVIEKVQEPAEAQEGGI